MKRSPLLWVTLVALAIGITLRVWGLGLPDLSTDEAQFVLGASAAQPPVGIDFFQLAERMFGTNVYAVRGMAAAWGFLGVALLSVVALFLGGGRETRLLVGLTALLFPSHVIFSRLAYLSAPLTACWLFLLVAFLLAEWRTTPEAILGLYGASFIATFIKTQALLVPVAFILYRAVRLRSRVVTDPITWALVLSLFPIGMYILAHPGILATVFQYGGNQYGILDVGRRVADLLTSYWMIMGVGLVLLPLALPSLRQMPGAWWIVVAIGLGQGFVLGPENPYYTTDLVLLALPIGCTLARLPHRNRVLALIVVTLISTVATVQTLTVQRRAVYWTTHAETINAVLADAPEVIVLGYAGHHLRWYLEPVVLIGKDMALRDRTGYFLLLDPKEHDKVPDGEEIYADGTVTILKRDHTL